MHGDMFQHAFETIGHSDLDVASERRSSSEVRSRKSTFAPRIFKVFGFDVRCNVHASGAFAHFGFDEFLSLLAGNRNAVMTIHHKIDLTNFVEDDGRKMDIFIKRAVDFLPAAGELIFLGKEGAVKFVIAVQTTRHLIQADSFDSPIHGTAHPKFFLDGIIGEQGVVGLSGETEKT
jgi:hypothetical protein